MKTRCLLVACFAASCASTVFGQQIFINDGSQPRNQMAERKKAFERELAFLIGDMERTCELNESQVKKLKLASKGAVAAAMEKFEKQQKQMRQRMAQAGMPVPPNDDEEEVDEEEAKQDEAEGEDDEAAVLGNLAAPIAMNMINVIGGGSGNSGASAAREARWVKAVEKVVSKEQREKYTAAVKARAAFARKAAVAAFIAKVDVKLLLSPDQRTKLTVLVDDEFGKVMAKRVGQNNGGMFFFGGGPGRQTAPIAHEELKPLLSEAQFAEWKQTFEKELNQLQPQRGFGGGFGNVIIRGAPAVQEIRIEAGGDGN